MSALRLLLLGLLVLILAGCATAPREDHPDVRQHIIEAALGQLGRPYRYGGSDSSGFDCSGLVQYAYGEAGVVVPRTTAEQRRAGESIRLAHLQPGDLLFYRFESGGLHVGIYVGDGRMVHAPASGQTVSLTAIDEPTWTRRFIGAIRLLR